MGQGPPLDPLIPVAVNLKNSPYGHKLRKCPRHQAQDRKQILKRGRTGGYVSLQVMVSQTIT